MIMMVAPTAMIAKKLALVAVCINVNGFRKLLIVRPASGSVWEPANKVRMIPRARITKINPDWGEFSADRSRDL